MKHLVLVLLLALILPLGSDLQAQGYRKKTTKSNTKKNQKSEKAVETDDWNFDIHYIKMPNKNYSSDGLVCNATWYCLPDVADLSFDGFWGTANYSLGIDGGIDYNWGILDSKAYSEKILSWHVGLANRIKFSSSVLELKAGYGNLKQWFTLFSGYRDERSDKTWSFFGSYYYHKGLDEGAWFLPCWDITALASIPNAAQNPLSWSNNALTHRLSGSATNTNAIHASTKLGLAAIDMGGETTLLSSISGSLGTYNQGNGPISYMGRGGEISLLYQKQPMLSVGVDYYSAWRNSQINCWQISTRLYLGAIQKLY